MLKYSFQKNNTGKTSTNLWNCLRDACSEHSSRNLIRNIRDAMQWNAPSAVPVVAIQLWMCLCRCHSEQHLSLNTECRLCQIWYLLYLFSQNFPAALFPIEERWLLWYINDCWWWWWWSIMIFSLYRKFLSQNAVDDQLCQQLQFDHR